MLPRVKKNLTTFTCCTHTCNAQVYMVYNKYVLFLFLVLLVHTRWRTFRKGTMCKRHLDRLRVLRMKSYSTWMPYVLCYGGVIYSTSNTYSPRILQKKECTSYRYIQVCDITSEQTVYYYMFSFGIVFYVLN